MVMKAIPSFQGNGQNVRKAGDVVTHQLSSSEQRALDDCECLIAKHLAEFFRVGQALLTIRDEKLYRERFSSFEEYCREKWGIGRSHAYRMLDAARVHQILSPTGDIPLPEHERQVRPLAKLPPKLAQEAWRLATERAKDRRPSAENVSKAVHEICKGKSKTATPDVLTWQQLVLPLLREAISKARRGDQQGVVDIIERAALRAQVGLRQNTNGGTGEE